MGLVSELQIIASDTQSSPLDVLRKALVVSNKLRQHNLSDWISKELNGYGPEDKVPDYRSLIAQVMYNLTNGFIQIKGATLELAPETSIDLRKSIMEIEHICDSSSDDFVKLSPSKKQIDMFQNYAKQQNPNCIYELYLSVHIAQFKHILESCKTKILEWALELESAGIVGENHTFKETEKQAAANKTSVIVNNTINNVQKTFSTKKKTVLSIIGGILIVGITSVWWNWFAAYTQDYVKPLYDTIKSFVGIK